MDLIFFLACNQLIVNIKCKTALGLYPTLLLVQKRNTVVHMYLIQIKIVLSVDPVLHVAGINEREASPVEELIPENHVIL